MYYILFAFSKDALIIVFWLHLGPDEIFFSPFGFQIKVWVSFSFVLISDQVCFASVFWLKLVPNEKI